MLVILDLMLYVVLSSSILDVMLMAMTAEEGDWSSRIEHHGGERMRLCVSHHFLVVFFTCGIYASLMQFFCSWHPYSHLDVSTSIMHDLIYANSRIISKF